MLHKRTRYCQTWLGVNKVSNKAGDEPNYKEMFSQSCGQLIRQRSKLEKLGGSRYKAEVQNY